MVPEMLISCCTIVLFSSNFFDLSSTAFEIYLFLCFSVWKLTLVVLSSPFKVEEFLHKMAISLKNCRVEQKNYSSLARWHDLPFSADHLIRILDILSADLDTSTSLLQSKTRLQKAFSPNAGALSLWHHHLNGYIRWCGCHEILTALCYTQEVFCPDQEKSQGNRNFVSRW